MKEDFDNPLGTKSNNLMQRYRELLSVYSSIEVSQKSSKIIRDEVMQSIEYGKPLQFIHTNEHLGDHLIIMSAIAIPLFKLLKKESIVTGDLNLFENSEFISSLISLKHQNERNEVNIKQLFTRWGYSNQLYQDVINNFYHSTMIWAADHLGVELDDSDLISPPIPLRCDFEMSPMINLDLNKINLYVEQFRNILDLKKTYCIILHGGRLPSKRFSRDQTRRIRKSLQTQFPNAGYIILSAQEIDVNGGKVLGEGDAEIVISATEDINKTIAIFLAVQNETFITTDTFLAWLGAGAIAQRHDRNGVLRPRDVYVLNTIASSEFWRISGSNHLESRAIRYLRSLGRLQNPRDHIIYPEEYYEYSGYLSYTNNPKEYIAEEDIADFLYFIFENNGVTLKTS